MRQAGFALLVGTHGDRVADECAADGRRPAAAADVKSGFGSASAALFRIAAEAVAEFRISPDAENCACCAGRRSLSVRRCGF